MLDDDPLQPTAFFDFDTDAIKGFVDDALRDVDDDDIARACALYLKVRDGIRYNPYVFKSDPKTFSASHVVDEGVSYCIPKAVLLGACARAVGIPSRLGLANVKNHLSSPQLIEFLQSDIFAMHGFIELFLDDKWVKATPAFDAALCERMGVVPLEFDGRHDSIFHEFTEDGLQHMEYLDDHGTFDDVPHAFIMQELERHYPHLFAAARARKADEERSLQADLEANTSSS